MKEEAKMEGRRERRGRWNGGEKGEGDEREERKGEGDGREERRENEGEEGRKRKVVMGKKRLG